MKKIIIFISLFIGIYFNINAQSIAANQLNGRLSIQTATNVSDSTWAISGYFAHSTGKFTTNQVAANDKFFIQIGANTYVGRISVVNSVAVNLITFRVICNYPNPPNGVGAIIRCTSNGYPVYVDGIANNLQAGIQNYFATLINSNAAGNFCEQTLTKIAHGFRKFTPIYWNGSTYIRPTADSLVPTYIVTDSTSANTFKVSNCGNYATTLTAGMYWFTGTSPGYTTTAPTVKTPLFEVAQGRLILQPLTGFNLAASGGGVTDGYKGDITVSGNTWTVNSGVITNGKLATNAVDSTKANNLSPNDLAQTGASTGQVLTWTGSKYAPRTTNDNKTPRDTIYVLVSGQSNAWGATGQTALDTTADSRVQIWNHVGGVNQWQTAHINQRPFRTSGYNSNDGGGSRNDLNGSVNHAFYMAKMLAQNQNKVVRLVFAIGDGRNISFWHNGTSKQKYLDTILTRSTSANIQRYDGMIWHQGESDYARSDNEYVRLFDSVKTILRTKPYFPPSTPIFVMGLLRKEDGSDPTLFFWRKDSLLRKFDYDGDPFTQYISSHDMVGHNRESNVVHFDSTSMRKLGLRLYERYIGWTAPEAGLIASLPMRPVTINARSNSLTLDSIRNFTVKHKKFMSINQNDPIYQDSVKLNGTDFAGINGSGLFDAWGRYNSTWGARWNFTDYSFFYGTRYSDDAGDTRWWLGHARGIPSAPTALIQGDRLGGIYFQGYNGSTWRKSASIINLIDTVIGINHRGLFLFGVAGDNIPESGFGEKMRIADYQTMIRKKTIFYDKIAISDPSWPILYNQGSAEETVSALIHIKMGGTAAAGTAPLKFTLSGHTQLGTPETGVVEPRTDGYGLLFTDVAGTRKEVQLQSIFSIVANTTLDATHNTVIIPLGSTFTVTLPAASSFTNKIYRIVNKKVGAVTTGSYVNLLGSTVTTLGIGTSILVQSDGTNWQQIQ